MSDIIERLHGPDGIEAAEEITRLREENARLIRENKVAFEAVGGVVKANDKLKEENTRLREATKRLILSISASWSAFEPGLREEIGNTNYVCVKEKIGAAAAAIREGGKDDI